MKKTILFWVLTCCTCVGQEQQEERVLYCTDEQGTGFAPTEGSQKLEHTLYQPQRHTVRIGKDSKYISLVSSTENIKSVLRCTPYENDKEYHSCVNLIATFTLNTSTMRFTYAQLPGWTMFEGIGINLSYGTCVDF